MTLLGGIQIFLFVTAVASVCVAFVIARRQGPPMFTLSRLFQAERGPVKPLVGAGWAAFVLLNTACGIAVQPLLAGALFVRAYVLRAICLRRGTRVG